MKYKATNVELVQELEALNEDGKYDELIEKAKAGLYHDVLKPDSVTEPKVHLCRALKKFPELKAILTDVLNSDYDESRNNEGIENLEVILTP